MGSKTITSYVFIIKTNETTEKVELEKLKMVGCNNET